MVDIIKNATIFYKNGLKEIYDGISILENGVYTGEIKSLDKDEEFIQQKFIPMDQIKRIIFLGENGKTTDIDFKSNKLRRKKDV